MLSRGSSQAFRVRGAFSLQIRNAEADSIDFGLEITQMLARSMKFDLQQLG